MSSVEIDVAEGRGQRLVLGLFQRLLEFSLEHFGLGLFPLGAPPEEVFPPLGLLAEELGCVVEIGRRGALCLLLA